MSRASKLTFAATGLGTMGIIGFVHWAQEADRAVCYSFDSLFLAYTYFLLDVRLCTEESNVIWKSSVSD